MSENYLMRANALSTSQDLQRAEQECERLRKENASLREANEIDLGEKMPLLVENAHLRARVKELEAREALWWEYEQFLDAENHGPILLDAAHGWMCPEDVIRRGRDYRKRLGIEREGDR